ncbi:hypothetical protein A2647_01345 [Candidatus Nomurabacteria bacterium RIFCSPHIGHO2_01_FULL_40_24b]|uniref:R3H domain-containing protein n=1 Tax=Candidatus Nomurabacteria bacterium RIFCSPHIGHO2_01_FULL_40_24b TaxID=1801739 RepID=A0A1F6V5W4_9BACT|nr:MAG: hypothetical protein A2647_01345 [Candidatus Nomurabacteria bacterium RIFCSPHIGHO2_01_FULL_40_24b]
MNKNEIINLIRELMEKTQVSSGDILVEEKDMKDNSKTHWFSVQVSDPYPFLRHEGEALFALNHLVRRIIESKISQKDAEENSQALEVMIDMNDFQKKRIENIHAIAHMMAERARYFKSSIEVDPMSAYERRIVHEFLSDATDLKTESEGVGHSRRVVIRYIGGI